MAKEGILNSAMNRFQLNFKRNVGAVSDEIRKCAPKTIEDWEEYYYKSVKSREHVADLGEKLHVKITEALHQRLKALRNWNASSTCTTWSLPGRTMDI